MNVNHEILLFNKNRKTLHNFSFDIEKPMLAEEWQEFVDAKDLANLVDATCDFKYVIQGSQFKYLTNSNYYTPKEWKEFLSYNLQRLNHMLDIIKSYGVTNEVYTKCLEIVCKCNALKTNKVDSNGKVIKGDIPNATELIKDLLIKEGLM